MALYRHTIGWKTIPILSFLLIRTADNDSNVYSLRLSPPSIDDQEHAKTRPKKYTRERIDCIQ